MIPADPGVSPAATPGTGQRAPAGNAAPLAFTVRKRVPHDMPFSVRANPIKYTLLFVASLGMSTVGLVSSAAGQTAEELRLTHFLMLSHWWLLAGYLVIIMLAMREPMLAVGPAGIWWQPGSPGRAVHLPWEGVALVQRRTGWLGASLAVHPRLDRFPDAVSVLTRRELWLLRSRGIRIQLGHIDRSPADVLAAIPYYSRGRCRVSG